MTPEAEDATAKDLDCRSGASERARSTAHSPAASDDVAETERNRSTRDGSLGDVRAVAPRTRASAANAAVSRSRSRPSGGVTETMREKGSIGSRISGAALGQRSGMSPEQVAQEALDEACTR
jgi:hypothetical protein